MKPMPSEPGDTPAFDPEPEALLLLPEVVARDWGVLPLTYHDRILTVVTSDKRPDLHTDLENILGVDEVIVTARATREQIEHAIDAHYPLEELLDDGEVTSFGFEDDPEL